MAKKLLVAVFIAMLVTGAAFAQNNTITVDLGPTIVGGVLGLAGDLIKGDSFNSSPGFGIAAQYERGLSDYFSLAGRFAYLKAGIGFHETRAYFENGLLVGGDVKLGMDFSSYSVECHLRVYPFAGAFFLDGMLGFAHMTTTFSGDLIVSSNVSGYDEKQSVDETASRNFFKTGGKLGWRVDFGRPGGFIFEPAFGYYYGVGRGDTIGTQLASTVAGDLGYTDFIDDVVRLLEETVFVGGPRVTLSFGWRF